MSETTLHQDLLDLVEDVRRTVIAPGPVESLAALRGRVHRLPHPALVADSTGQYQIVNAAATRLTGYTVDELLRLSVWELTPGTDAADGDVLWRAFLQQHRQTGVYRLLRKDGRRISVRYAAQAHVLAGLHLVLLEPALIGDGPAPSRLKGTRRRSPSRRR